MRVVNDMVWCGRQTMRLCVKNTHDMLCNVRDHGRTSRHTHMQVADGQVQADPGS